MIGPRPRGRTANGRPAPDRARIGLRALQVLFVVLLVHLVAQLFEIHLLAEITQPMLLIPLMVLVIDTVPAPRPLMIRLALAGLFFSWLGDTLPRFMDDGFVAMLACFLVAHLIYIAALWPLRRSCIVVRRPNLSVAYLAAAVALVLICSPGAGTMLPLVIAYAAVITVMALLATSLGKVGTWGAILFMFSDSLIALRSFAGLEFFGYSALVMLTYVVAQVMLALAFVRAAGLMRRGQWPQQAPQAGRPRRRRDGFR